MTKWSAICLAKVRHLACPVFHILKGADTSIVDNNNRTPVQMSTKDTPAYNTLLEWIKLNSGESEMKEKEIVKETDEAANKDTLANKSQKNSNEKPAEAVSPREDLKKSKDKKKEDKKLKKQKEKKEKKDKKNKKEQTEVPVVENFQNRRNSVGATTSSPAASSTSRKRFGFLRYLFSFNHVLTSCASMFGRSSKGAQSVASPSPELMRAANKYNSVQFPLNSSSSNTISFADLVWPFCFRLLLILLFPASTVFTNRRRIIWQGVQRTLEAD